MTHHTRTREMRKERERERGLVRNAAIRRADATGCGFRATGSSRGTFMGQDSHRTAKPGRRPHCGGLLIESRSGCYNNALSLPVIVVDSTSRAFIARDASARSCLFRENLNYGGIRRLNEITILITNFFIRL